MFGGTGLLVLKYFYFFAPNTNCALVVALSEKCFPSTIQYGYRKCVTLARVCPKHSRIGTARMKEDKETDSERKKRGMSMERSKTDIQK